MEPTAMRALTRILVEGYLSLKSADLELRPGEPVVVIGPNGAGKSNLLSALRLIPLIRTRSLRRFVGEEGGGSALLHYGPQMTREIDLRLEFSQDRETSAYEARLVWAAGDALIFADESVECCAAGVMSTGRLSLGAGHAESRLEDEARNPDEPTARVLNWLISQMSFFHFHDTSRTSPLRQNSRQEDASYLRSDGSNLAAYLRALSMAEGAGCRAAWTRIQGLIRRIAPFIKQLKPTLVDPSIPERSAVRLDWLDERDQVFGPHHLSDGTLRAIALFTALGQPEERLPAFISIDEPELGLHPAAIELLVSLVRSVSTHCQVILATQSPALLDFFDAGEVIVAERANGESTFRRLDPEALESWLDDYTLSELYDKNVIGGRP
jgi:predicted ATPase